MAAILAPRHRAAAPRLAPGEVHAWRVELAGAAPSAAAACLAPDEVARARRFAFERDRRRYVRARSALRRILAGYLGVAPADVALAYSLHGKPRLAAPAPLGFNVSHSGDHALVAVSRAAQVGVDIEVVDRSRATLELARDVFTADEVAQLATHAGGVALPFFTCWTRKEAYLKAIGLGLTIDPRTVHVGADPGRREIPSLERRGECVEVATLPREGDVAAAIAVVGGFAEVRRFEA